MESGILLNNGSYFRINRGIGLDAREFTAIYHYQSHVITEFLNCSTPMLIRWGFAGTLDNKILAVTLIFPPSKSWCAAEKYSGGKSNESFHGMNFIIS